ncbi:MAG: hypothetical protein K6G75_13080 [Lachnospiraceae bacterium]|nr:hypothetical protein [Lachnospiraceae bacterium]
MNNCEELEIIIKQQIGNLRDNIEQIYSELLSPAGRLLMKNSKEISAVYRIVKAITLSGDYNSSGLKDHMELEELIELDDRLRFFVYRAFSNPCSENTLRMFLSLMEEQISVYFFAIYATSLNFGLEKTILNISQMFDAVNKRKESIIFLNACLKLGRKKEEIRNKLIEEYNLYGMQEEALKLREEEEKINE